MKSINLVATALLFGAACGGDPTASVASAVGQLPAADPKLPAFTGWVIAFDLDNDGFEALDCHVTLSRSETVVRTLAAAADLEVGTCAVTWDGLDDNGAYLTPGVVDVVVDVAEPVEGEAELEVAATLALQLEVVRVGIAQVDISGDGRVPLMYGAVDGQQNAYYLIPEERPAWRIGPDSAEPSEAVRIELADGSPRAAPEPWGDLRSPPLDGASDDGTEQDTYNLPTAFVAGSTVDFAAELNADVAGAPGSGAPTLAQVRLVAPEGTELVGEGLFAAGGWVTARATTSPVSAVGRFDVAMAWRFEARMPEGEWVAMPGAVTTTHRIYGFAGQPRWDHSTVQHTPWIEVVDTVAGWVDGSTADPIAVAGRIVEGVYWEFDLVYDRESGASAYTWYPGWGWEGGQFDLTAFLDRGDGNVINCSDAASIVGTYANMIGIDFRYRILQRPDQFGFDLNYIKAIGWDEFDETPFFGDRGQFRYHAVVSPLGGSFYDATLALDGDGDPLTPPHVELLAVDMPPDDYLEALSSEWTLIDTVTDEQVEIR